MRNLGIAILLILALILSIWLTVKAPCEWFQYSAVKDVPARCVMQ